MPPATESANAEASTTTTDTATTDTAAAPASPEQKRKELKARLVAKAAGAVVTDDVPIKAKADESAVDKQADKSKDKQKDGKKPDAKAKTGKDAGKADKKDGDEPEVEGDQKALVKGWRDLRHAKKKFTEQQTAATEKLRRAEELERRQAEQAEAFEKDPLAWLKARGKNVREVLLRVAREDGEDPKDKTLREVKTKAEELEKKLTEREKREQEQETERKAREAQQKIERQLLDEYEGSEGDEYPTLAAHLEPAQVAEAARSLLLKYYREHGQELSPREFFVRLETALRQREERREARLKKSGKTDGAGAPRSPDRGRAAARGDAGNLEDDDETTPRRPADVTSRETRLSTTRPSGGEDKAALKRRLVAVAASRIVS